MAGEALGEGACRLPGEDKEEAEMAEKEVVQTESELEFGSKKCVCPKCGTEAPHAFRGVPCSKTKCPKCGSAMKGTQCGD